MTQNNNLSPLPFYDNVELQNHRKPYAYGEVYPLFAEINKLLPFQIYLGSTASQFISVSIASNTESKSISVEMKEAGLKIVTTEIGNYLVFPAIFPMALNLKEGQYMLQIKIGDKYFYSDVFTAVNDISRYLKIEWYDVENLEFDAGVILYKEYKPFIYLDTDIGKPEYTFNETAVDRDGYTFIEKQISEKTYRFTVLASEPMCDIMRFIQMADFISIRDKYGRAYKCDTFLMTPEWQEQGDIASVECEFQTNTVVKKIGKGYTVLDKGDFNSSFNGDFSND